MTCKFNERTGEMLEYPIRSAFQNFYPDYAASHPVTGAQAKAASCIRNCKTGSLGYTLEECPECGFKRIHARSCNSRDCPCCQAPMEKKWVMERNSELIPGIAYYHVVFTLPGELNPLIHANPNPLYNLLFSAASDTLITLCKGKKFMGALPGIVSVLHTWGQKLNFHPHLHVMLSGGGLTTDGKFLMTGHKGFIIPVKVVGKVFRGKFLETLKKLYRSGQLVFPGSISCLQDTPSWEKFPDSLYGKEWIPFLKETFNGNGNALEYLARYAYRTAISNSRIEDVSNEDVTFRYKDYADGSTEKRMVVKGTEFIRLFLQHVLPGGFHRVRFSGFLSNCRKTGCLKLIGDLMRTPYTGNPAKGMHMEELMMKIYGADICACPLCHQKLHRMFIRSMHPPNLA